MWLSRAGREVKETETDNVIFILTKEDVLECAREMGIPAETITQDVSTLENPAILDQLKEPS